jgi:hypothetical protein
MNNSLAIACQGPLGSSTTFLDEKQCTLPRENTFVNNQYGVLLELNGQTLSSDLQVLREISGYAGTLNAGASDIMVDDYGNEMASNLNEFDLQPKSRTRYEIYYDDGPPKVRKTGEDQLP